MLVYVGCQSESPFSARIPRVRLLASGAARHSISDWCVPIPQGIGLSLAAKRPPCPGGMQADSQTSQSRMGQRRGKRRMLERSRSTMHTVCSATMCLSIRHKFAHAIVLWRTLTFHLAVNHIGRARLLLRKTSRITSLLNYMESQLQIQELRYAQVQ